MFVIGLYMSLLLDLATLSAKLSAYVLVAIGVISELTLMLIALCPGPRGGLTSLWTWNDSILAILGLCHGSFNRQRSGAFSF